MVRIHQTRVPMWVQQADAVLSQANPVSGTKYTVLDTVKNARIMSMEVDCAWTVQPTPLQLHVTIDGQTIIFSLIDPATATGYYAKVWPASAEDSQGLDGATVFPQYKPFIVEGKSIKIEAEITGGTVQSLDARIKYALRR